MGLLLDTCALIFLVNGERMPDEARQAVESAEDDNTLYVSPVSAWEIGLVARSRRDAPQIFRPDPQRFVRDAFGQPNLRLAALTAEIAFQSSFLPMPFHADPADRLIVETARVLDLPILTRDRAILAYAARGHVAAVAC